MKLALASSISQPSTSPNKYTNPTSSEHLDIRTSFHSLCRSLRKVEQHTEEQLFVGTLYFCQRSYAMLAGFLMYLDLNNFFPKNLLLNSRIIRLDRSIFINISPPIKFIININCCVFSCRKFITVSFKTVFYIYFPQSLE